MPKHPIVGAAAKPCAGADPTVPTDLASRRACLHQVARVVLTLLPLSGCALTPSGPPPAPAPLSPDAAARLAPTGRLRAAINLGNPILARRDAGNWRAEGVSVDLATALAGQLGVPIAWQVVDSAAQSVEAVTRGQADIGFFAVDPERAQGIRFTPPYVLIEGAYLVRDASPLTDNAQVDRPGIRVMVGQGSAYDLYLSRALKSATLLRAPTSPRVVERFLAEGADVAAGVRQQLEADAARVGGLRLLPGRFMQIDQAMGLPADRGEAARHDLTAFVTWAKASGFVAQALERHGIRGARVAPG